MRRFGCVLLACLAVAPVGFACELANLVPVDFGIYDVFSARDDDSSGSIDVRCTPASTAYTVKLSAGASGSFKERLLFNGADTLAYNLYLDAARTQVWGDGSSGTVYLSDRRRRTVTFYGRVPAGQDPAVGVYSDRIVALVEY